MVVIHTHQQTVFVALDVEDYPFCGNNAGRRKLLFELRRTSPTRAYNNSKPRIQMILQDPAQARINPVADKSAQCASRDDSHMISVHRSQYGSKGILPFAEFPAAWKGENALHSGHEDFAIFFFVCFSLLCAHGH
jgi:hypothetical protein